MGPLNPLRHLIPVVLVLAALLAAGLVAIASRPGDTTGAGDAPALTAPALRLADRAGLVTVAMAAHAEGLELTLMPPAIEADPPSVRDVAVGAAGGPLAPLETERCGDLCTRVTTVLPPGDVTVRVRVAFAGRTSTARFRVPWPLPPDASTLLERADARTRALSRVTVRERVTSDPSGGFFPNPPRVVTGDLLAGTLSSAPRTRASCSHPGRSGASPTRSPPPRCGSSSGSGPTGPSGATGSSVRSTSCTARSRRAERIGVRVPSRRPVRRRGRRGPPPDPGAPERMSSHIHRSHESVSGGFTETASDYEDAVRFNIEGAQRLVLSIPPGVYDDVLDVGCGTGWAAQAVIDRFRPARITGVDPAGGMLEKFAAKLGGIDGVEVTLAQADVETMPVPEASFDLAICSMAYHWFPRKWEAAAAMARALRPGGVVAILMSGRGGEQAYRDVISNVEPINYRWVGAFDGNLRSVPEMEDYLVSAGLEPVDIWMETRVRHTTVEAYMERMRVVAGHMIGDQSEAEVADYVAKIEAELRRRSGPRGWRYEFAKLFAIARKPA